MMCRYQCPIDRESAFATAQRKAKEQAVADRRALADRYGDECGAIMAQILAMKQPERKPKIKATRDDLEAVQQLPDVGLATDD